MFMSSQQRRLLLWGGGGCLCFLFSLVAAISIGSADLSFITVWSVIWHHLTAGWFFPIKDIATDAIVWEIRLPRVLLAAVVGAVLSLSGVIFQGILRNTLADPYVLGVSSGAAAGAVLSIYTGFTLIWASQWATPLLAIIGAVIALFVLLLLSRSVDKQKERFILAGIVVQAFFGAIVTVVISLSKTEMPRIVFWLMGSLALREWQHLIVVTIVFVLGFSFAIYYSRELNIFSLGDRMANHLGVHVAQIRLVLLIVASMMTAVAVSVTGTIGFVGLVVPHIMRMLLGGDHRLLIPLSVIFGAIFLIWADLLARTLFSPTELPIGVITAFVGVPFFAYLLQKRR